MLASRFVPRAIAPLTRASSVVATRVVARTAMCIPRIHVASRAFTTSRVRLSDSSSNSSDAPSTTTQPPRVNSLVLTAAGPDRPGIVHALTKLLVSAGANVEESRMSILGSDFAILLRVTAPESLGVKELKSLVEKELSEFAIGVRSTQNTAPLSGPVRILSVAVEGPDQPGVVQSLTKIFHDMKGSIRDLDTDSSNAPFAGYKIFALKCVVAFPINTNFEEFEKALHGFEDAYGFDVQVQEGVNRDFDEEMDDEEGEEGEGEEEEEEEDERPMPPTRRPAAPTSSAAARRPPPPASAAAASRAPPAAALRGPPAPPTRGTTAASTATRAAPPRPAAPSSAAGRTPPRR